MAARVDVVKPEGWQGLEVCQNVLYNRMKSYHKQDAKRCETENFAVDPDERGHHYRVPSRDEQGEVVWTIVTFDA